MGSHGSHSIVFVLLFFLLPFAVVEAQPRFEEPIVLPVPDAAPDVFIAGDFTGDGEVDLVVGDSRIGGLHLIAADRRGGFEPARLVYTTLEPGAAVTAIEAADLDEDGLLDLAIRQRPGGIGVLLTRRSTDVFELVHTVDSIGDFEFHDLDQDGHQDLVRIDIGLSITVLHGDGRGGLGREENYPITPAFLFGTELKFADLDGDGREETVLATSSFFGFGPVEVLRFDGSAFNVLEVADSFFNARRLHVEDLDGDLRSDVVATVGLTVVLFGEQEPLLVPGPFVSMPASTDAVVDLDGDGNLDLVGTDRGRPGEGNGEVAVALGDGAGNFSDAVILPAGNSADRVLVADLGGSCGPDLVTLSQSSSDVAVHRNRSEVFAPGFEGAVNAGRGRVVDILFLNGAVGSGPDRRLEYDVLAPFELRMRKPPAVPEGEEAPFAAYVWFGTPEPPSAGSSLPRGMGCSPLPMPISGGDPQPDVIWNNLGRFARLGLPDRGSSPAPSVLVSRPGRGLPGARRFVIQGIIYDPGSRAGIPASLTNGITAVPVFRP